ncbi:NADH-quinone oxidoreductase subunit E [Palleronia abyssalis]|uniref:NADH-quinone oxidoreductase chain 2 n=1 Tax=Palleronia abyssalis TaxID=1501240 RepID=A0A2R8BRX9_9RHOB|nr:NADH-quinone oxidoreductase subunit E [Palleronia abyssalis]SPJ22898.1 NADH-quinone oxidoreductase chain 2 [Palleronia abyssalis]
MLRRLHTEQPESFAFTEANQKWAEAQISKYPEGRQASAVIALLWRAQEQEGWLSRPAIEHVAGMLGMAYIRALEVATFYFMFQLQPVGTVAHVQVCGTTSCMICGAEDLIGVCKEKIAKKPHQISSDGKFSWEEVECLGACANAPMAQIGKDYYEDLTAESLAHLLDEMAAGKVPTPGSQTGRFASEPAGGVTSLHNDKVNASNASVSLATEIGDTLKRIDGTEVRLRAPWNPAMDSGAATPPPVNDDLLGPTANNERPTPGAQPGADKAVNDHATTKQESDADNKARPDEGEVAGVSKAGDATPEGGAYHAAGESGETVQSETRETSTHAGDAPLSRGMDTSAEDDPVNAEASDVPEGEETRPEVLETARGSGADDLKQIKGVGPKLEQTLHGMGIFHFDQIAGWSARELAWIDRNLEGFKGRVIRDNWVGQAKVLSREGQTDG